MKKYLWLSLIAFSLGGSFGTVLAQPIVIHEIMYHPSSEDVLEEFIELYNPALTNANVSGWRIRGGIDFLIPAGTMISAQGYLVLAANTAAFAVRYPGVANVVGGWTGRLSNNRDSIVLDDTDGSTVDQVTYADEGEWAIRARDPVYTNPPGWIWYKEHDGLGKSLELVNPSLPNEHGQNWASSASNWGTPGAVNSRRNVNIAPMVLEVSHFPIIPTSSDTIRVTCLVINEQAQNVTVRLHWRVDSASPSPFTASDMFDDGFHNDGAPNDGRYGAAIGTLPDDSIVEFYVEAMDGQGNIRTWPAPARQSNNSFAQNANAVLQVENNAYTGSAPLYKLIMTEEELQNLADVFDNAPQSDAQQNATFISLEQGTPVLRYLVAVRNRGHGSRGGTPHNYRINYRSDEPYDDAVAINLNARTVHAQHLGAMLAQKAGAIGGDSRSLELRVNNGPGPGGTPNDGRYAANEVIDSHWAENHFPFNQGGNVYKVIRDINPPNFDYRGTDPFLYQNTYFKQSNESENDWTDLIGMLAVMGENSGAALATESARAVADVDQWLRHLAVMSLMGNNESGLNTGNNDDYYLYRGLDDPRFILAYHDLDQILGFSSQPTTASIFRAATCCGISGQSEGSWRAMDRIMHWPDFEPIYYAILQELLDTTFSAAEFDRLVDQVLGDYISSNTRQNIKNWMNGRRSYVQGVLSATSFPRANFATITGEPQAVTWRNSASLTVGGAGIVSYRWRLNNTPLSAETLVNQNINLSNLPNGSTNTVFVLGKNATGAWQDFRFPTASRTWVVDTTLPRVRINEVLAHNDAAYNHEGTFPDVIELFNEFVTPINLEGMGLSDDATDPYKFVFPPNTTVGPLAYLILLANDPDATSGMHVGFSLDQDGEELFLHDRAANGGRLIATVRFGHQLTDRSIGLSGVSGVWKLNTPTPGLSNIEQPVGDASLVRVNEWLAAGEGAFPDDYIELYNPGALPVSLDNLFLTDEPIGAPLLSKIDFATFIGAGSHVALIADGDDDRSGHVNFRLSSTQGKIALMNPWGKALDCVFYSSQQVGVSEGRCPDGGDSYSAQAIPTPGVPNACPTEQPDPQLVTLIAGNHTWRYESTGTDLGTTWREIGYPDGSWPSGQAILGIEMFQFTPDPIRTMMSWNFPQQITFYFRTTFTLPAGTITGLQLEHAIDDGAVFYINGREAYRYNMPGGAIFYNTLAPGFIGDISAYSQPVNLPLDFLQAGENYVAVEVHNNQSNSGDILFGMRLSGVVATNGPASSGVVINEVLASNASIVDPDGTTSDLVEFYNPSAATVNMAGLSVSDTLANPTRWVFPAGSIIPAQGYLTIRLDSSRPSSFTNTGFGLSATGDAIYLFDTPGNGGGVLDSLQFGIQVTDYSVGRVPDGSIAVALTVPTFGEANIAATLDTGDTLKINEWMADPDSGEDWFELYNPASLPVAVGGWFLTDNLGDIMKSKIPALSFLGGATNGWQRFVADGDTEAGADHADFSLRAEGESIALFRADGLQIDAVSFGPQTVDVSEGRLPDGSATLTPFATTASPGEANHLPLTSVVVNEVLTHSDPPLEDAIELLNTSGASVNIGGWWLSDAKSQLRKYQIPANTVLPPGGFIVFYENSFNNGDIAAYPFSLSSAEGDQVHMSAASGGIPTGYRHTADFGPAFNAVPFGRFPTSVGFDFVPLLSHTFGVSAPVSVEQFRQGQGAPNTAARIGSVVFTEIMYHPPLDGTNDNVLEEFLELHNRTANPIRLYDLNHPENTWRLRKGVDYDFPQGVILPAGGYLLVVSFDPDVDTAARAEFESRYGANLILFGPYQGKLDNGGEALELQAPDNPQNIPGPDFGLVPYVTLERVEYDDAMPWPLGGDGDGQSLQRTDPSLYGNDPAHWSAGAPTPEPGSGGLLDTDMDGMPDAYEMANDLDHTRDDSMEDADQDGMTNLDEYLAGTDPQDPGSLFELEILPGTPGQVQIRFAGLAGRTYSVRYQTTLGDPLWMTLTNLASLGIDQTVTIFDSAPQSTGQRFYRVVTPSGL